MKPTNFIPKYPEELQATEPSSPELSVLCRPPPKMPPSLAFKGNTRRFHLHPPDVQYQQWSKHSRTKSYTHRSRLFSYRLTSYYGHRTPISCARNLPLSLRIPQFTSSPSPLLVALFLGFFKLTLSPRAQLVHFYTPFPLHILAYGLPFVSHSQCLKLPGVC